MHYQQGGGKYPIHASRGRFASRERKIGKNAFVHGELAFWELFVFVTGS
jgi:hypothetical protein